MRTNPGLALLLAALAGGLAHAGTDDPASAWQHEAAANRSLGLELELAKGKGFYLVLDSAASRLRLMLQGVVLEEFPVERLDLGLPERLFVNGAAPDEMRSRVWSAGALDPPNRDERQVIRVPDPKTPPDELEPPMALPPVAAPERYFVRFAGPLVLEVRSAGSSSLLGRLVEAAERRLDDLTAVVKGRTASRVRVFLRDADAELLYQSLPPETQFLVL